MHHLQYCKDSVSCWDFKPLSACMKFGNTPLFCLRPGYKAATQMWSSPKGAPKILTQYDCSARQPLSCSHKSTYVYTSSMEVPSVSILLAKKQGPIHHYRDCNQLTWQRLLQQVLLSTTSATSQPISFSIWLAYAAIRWTCIAQWDTCKPTAANGEVQRSPLHLAWAPGPQYSNFAPLRWWIDSLHFT